MVAHSYKIRQGVRPSRTSSAGSIVENGPLGRARGPDPARLINGCFRRWCSAEGSWRTVKKPAGRPLPDWDTPEPNSVSRPLSASAGRADPALAGGALNLRLTIVRRCWQGFDSAGSYGHGSETFFRIGHFVETPIGASPGPGVFSQPLRVAARAWAFKQFVAEGQW